MLRANITNLAVELVDGSIVLPVVVSLITKLVVVVRDLLGPLRAGLAVDLFCGLGLGLGLGLTVTIKVGDGGGKIARGEGVDNLVGGRLVVLVAPIRHGDGD